MTYTGKESLKRVDSACFSSPYIKISMALAQGWHANLWSIPYFLNQKWHKQMEKYTMFVDWKNQYSENEYITQSNLQTEYNPYQATNGIFHRTRINNFTICMEIQKTSNSQSNLKKEEWNWKNKHTWLQTILQSYSHQDRMVLAQRQKYRSMEPNRKPRDKSTHLWTPYLW